MPRINASIDIPDAEIELRAIRAQGPGGQNVNKVASAVHLRFDINASSALPEPIKQRLMALRDRRITAAGIINIKAQRSRSQDKNKADAIRRFTNLILKVTSPPKSRKKTRPPKKAKEQRLADKAHRGKVKRLRRNMSD